MTFCAATTSMQCMFACRDSKTPVDKSSPGQISALFDDLFLFPGLFLHRRSSTQMFVSLCFIDVHAYATTGRIFQPDSFHFCISKLQ